MMKLRFGNRLAAFSALGLLALLSVTLLALPGCGSKATGDPTVGFIYIGPKDDYGYSQAHAKGAAAVKKIPGVKVLEVEKVRGERRRPADHEEHDRESKGPR